MRRIKLLYIFEENLPPEEFQWIETSSAIVNAVEYLPEQSLRDVFTPVSWNILRRKTGASAYQSGGNPGKIAAQELMFGELVAITAHMNGWSPFNAFFIDEQGLLKATGHQTMSLNRQARVIHRYQEMMQRYGYCPRPTVKPSSQIVRVRPLQRAEEPTSGKYRAPLSMKEPLSKAERWQERKSLIGKGQQSVYPDAKIAAARLAENNMAVEKARLAGNVYGNGQPINALNPMPNVPEGWQDISNDNQALSKIGLNSGMLYDHPDNPDFFARVYQPDSSVFGHDMNPTVVFRGSRVPEFPDGIGSAVKKALIDGDTSGIKNINDWSNNLNQGIGSYSEYYKKAVGIGDKLSKYKNVDISGHSLGGGMASAAAMASGKSTWTFNAAGLNADTVEKYGGTVMGNASNIQAYRVDGELLTKVQEINLWEDAQGVNFNTPALLVKETISALSPDAIGTKHTLPGGTGSLVDKHGFDQAIRCIEAQKDEDIAIIRNRI